MVSSTRLLPWALVCLLFTVLYLMPLGVRPLSAPDEFRYAEVPWEMLQSGDWVVPRIAGEVYFEKPVLGYWLTALSMKTFGDGAFAVRLPSALATLGTALLLGLLLSRYGGDRRAGPLAAAALLTSFLPVALGVTALLDASFSLFLTAVMIFFFLALEAETRTRADGWFAAAGAAIGLAFLTKGFLAIVLPGLALLPYPWGLLVAERSDFWRHFFWTVHVQRFLHPDANQHLEPIWFYLPRILVVCLPWTVLLPSAWQGLRRSADAPATSRLRLLAAFWLGMPLLFFSISSGKLITYLLVCVPPALILLIEPTLAAVRNSGRAVLRLPTRVHAGLAVILLAALPIAVWALPEARRVFAENPLGAWSVAGGLVAWCIWALIALRPLPTARRLGLLAVAPALLLLGGHLLLDSSLLRTPSPEMVELLAGLDDETTLIAGRDTVRAMCWLTGRTDMEIAFGAGELEYGLGQESGRSVLDGEELRELVESRGDVVVMLSARRWDKVAADLPEPARTLRTHKLVLAAYGQAAVANGTRGL